MIPKAIEQAERHYLTAVKSADELRSAKSFDDAMSAWSSFLSASSTIYAKLEQGAKGCSKSEPWFGTKRVLRKSDPLLRYILVSRNVDTHGIEDVTIKSSDNPFLNFNEMVPVVVSFDDDETGLPVELDAICAGPTLKLNRVECKRYGAADPPGVHLGKDVPFGRDYPHAVAKLALEYLRSLIDEAKRLPS
ncbi:hypothetical protein MCERH10_02341 [Caulobacteraceae bacterium]|eukprot:gene7717-10488_t